MFVKHILDYSVISKNPFFINKLPRLSFLPLFPVLSEHGFRQVPWYSSSNCCSLTLLEKQYLFSWQMDNHSINSVGKSDIWHRMNSGISLIC
uniref:Ovule protein n=1 Tax=Meloidogyne incognita TaxID=6306 RepID=A0A914NKL7_MELIC